MKAKKSEKNSALDVFQYEDIRAFLLDFIAFKKKSRSSFSLRELSTRAGFKSGGMLSMAIHGQRKLSLESASRLADAIGLRGRKKEYFITLAQVQKEKVASAKNSLQQKLLRLGYQSKKSALQTQQYLFLSEWHYPALFVMIGLKDFQYDPLALARRLKRGITPLQVQKAIADMLELGLIESTGNKYTQKHFSLETGDDLLEPAMLKYHLKMTELAKEALDLPSLEREFSALTIHISARLWPKLKERIREFRMDILDFVQQEPEEAGEVFQVNLQAFPLTETSKK